MKSRNAAWLIVLPVAVVGIFLLVKKTSFNNQSLTSNNMTISSTAFQHNGFIPQKFTCDGADINPPLKITEVPAGAKSLALIVDDPDAPTKTWVHWLVWNIAPATSEIAEGSVPAGAVKGMTDFGRPGYGGPCPPSGIHRYFFKIYALDSVLSLSASANKAELEKAMTGHVLGQGQLVGKYTRK